MPSPSDPHADAGELLSHLGEAAVLLVADLIAARTARGDQQAIRRLKAVQACLGKLTTGPA